MHNLDKMRGVQKVDKLVYGVKTCYFQCLDRKRLNQLYDILGMG